MDNYILERPELPNKIREAIDNETLAVFIGAGVSRLVGCLGWNELAKRLIAKCLDLDVINFKQSESLSQTTDHKKTITICHHLLDEKKREDIFFEEMEKSFNENGEPEHPNIYDHIYKLRGLFLTTNADTHFDGQFIKPKIVFKVSDFQKENMDRKNLYHIHGLITEPKSMIFTLPQYFAQYRNTNFKEFLDRIFNVYTVLFLGYGVGEFEILDFMLKDFIDSKSESKHFMLSPFFKGEENILKIEQRYYSDLGINLIGYEKDKKGYEQLVEVIKYWSEEVNQVTTALHKESRSIENIVDSKPTKKKIQEAFQLIKNDKSLENFFFRKLAESAKPLPWLQPLKTAGYFAPYRNPRFQENPKDQSIHIPHWNILDVLYNMAMTMKIEKEESIKFKIPELLLGIVNEIILYKDDKNQRVDNYRTDWVLLKVISHLPIKYIETIHIQFIKDALCTRFDTCLISNAIEKMFLPKLIKEKANTLIIELLDIILHFKKPEKQHDIKFKSILDRYYFKEILSKNKSGIIELCPLEAAKVALSKMKEILEIDHTQFNYVWIPAIEDHEQTSFPEDYECQLVYFVRDALEAVKPDQFVDILKDMLYNKNEIFIRLAYHLINYHYNAFSDLLWHLPHNPLNLSNIHELFELFKKHCKEFTEEQIKIVLEWIETKDYYYSDEVVNNPDKKEIAEARYKKEWLLSLIGSEDKEVIQQYEHCNTIFDTKIKHPGFHYWSGGVHRVQSVSPISEEKFSMMKSDEIVKYLNLYKCEDDFSEDFMREDITTFLRQFVSNNTQKFLDDLDTFLGLKQKYQYELLRGFEEAWKNKRTFEWQYLLNFIKQIIGNDTFWNEKPQQGEYDYNDLIARTIADLIQAGTRHDENSFSKELLPDAEKIILILLKKIRDQKMFSEDFVSSAINSTKGRVFIAAINYSLRYARVNSHDKNNRWVKSIKTDFTSRLDKNKESSFAFSTIIGEYIPNLIYLDEEWVNRNFNKIFDLGNDKYWEATFSGYLLTHTTVYEAVYMLLLDKRHYKKALEYSFKDEQMREKLIQNIAIGYFAGWDNISNPNGLIYELLKTAKVENLKYLISFISFSKNEDNDDSFKCNLKPLWKAIIERIKPKFKQKEYCEIASDLWSWISIVDTIDDDIYGWLKISAENLKNNWHRTYFSSDLLKHVENTPEKVGELFLSILNFGNYPDYKAEEIVDIVKILYKSGNKRTANRICNIYLENGFEFLRVTFDLNK